MKYCTKCKKEMPESQVFCPACGTKQYIPAENKTHSGELLLQIPGCKFYKLLLPLECTLTVTDQKISAVGSNGRSSYLEMELKNLSSVSIVRQGLSLRNNANKSFQLALPAGETDFVPYVKALIEDYWENCINLAQQETAAQQKVAVQQEVTTQQEAAKQEVSLETGVVPERYPFTRWYTYGHHQYYRAGDEVAVEFVNKDCGIRKVIVDKDARIVHFPGIVKEEGWTKELTSEGCLEPCIRFRTDFEEYDEERYIMIWQVQPDGRYWADDDGYGWESDEEIRLYAFIDRNGDFMGPFRVYNVGSKKYLQ